MRTYASSRVTRKSCHRKSELQMFYWFPAAILVDQKGTPIWRLHTKLYQGAWNVLANNSETMGHKDLRLGQIVYILVFCNISFSRLLQLDGFQFIFFVAWHWKWSIARTWYWNDFKTFFFELVPECLQAQGANKTFPSNAKRKFSKIFYVENKRLALLSLLFLSVLFVCRNLELKCIGWKNRPFYSCGLGTLAFEWMWGWRWPCFDTNLLCFVMEIVPEKY